MGKRKGSRSLFEVMGTKAQKNVRVPDWMARGGAEGAESPRTASAEDHPVAVPALPRGPTVSVVAGRLRLNLNYLTCLLLCLGLVVLLVGAYKLGQATASTGDGDGQPGPAVKPGNGDPTDPDDPGPGPGEQSVQAEAVERIKRGGVVLVIQGAVNTEAEAFEIQEYLAGEGFVPAVRQNMDATYRVYDSRDTTGWSDEQLIKYVNRLEELGRGRRYTFTHPRGSGIWRETFPATRE